MYNSVKFDIFNKIDNMSGGKKKNGLFIYITKKSIQNEKKNFKCIFLAKCKQSFNV